MGTSAQTRHPEQQCWLVAAGKVPCPVRVRDEAMMGMSGRDRKDGRKWGTDIRIGQAGGGGENRPETIPLEEMAGFRS